MKPRRRDTLPWDPYPDEPEFFGQKLAMNAARWRELRRAAQTAQSQDDQIAGLRARARLLALEVMLIRDNDLYLAERSSESGPLGSNRLDRQEAWRWRLTELETIEARIETAERELARKNRSWIKKLFLPFGNR